MMSVIRFFRILSIFCIVFMLSAPSAQAKWFFLQDGKKKEESVSTQKRITATPRYETRSKKAVRKPLSRVQISPVFRNRGSADPQYLELLSQARSLDPMLFEVGGPAPQTQDELRQMAAVRMMDKVAYMKERRVEKQKKVEQDYQRFKKQHAALVRDIERAQQRQLRNAPRQNNTAVRRAPASSPVTGTTTTRKKPARVFRSY
jgi:hypothetical protein